MSMELHDKKWQILRKGATPATNVSSKLSQPVTDNKCMPMFVQLMDFVTLISSLIPRYRVQTKYHLSKVFIPS